MRKRTRDMQMNIFHLLLPMLQLSNKIKIHTKIAILVRQENVLDVLRRRSRVKLPKT